MEDTFSSTPLAVVSLAELRQMRRDLAAESERRMARLDALEARKTELDRQGAVERSLRGQKALARRLADLDRQAALEARLIRLLDKQRNLLDHLIGAREDAARWARLRAVAPAAVELTWEDLRAAAADLDRSEAHLDDLLRVLGAPEEERPRSGPPAAVESSAERGPGEAALGAEALDGRTIRLATGETVRYIGVDTPLLQGVLGQPELGAREAWQANHRLVEGRRVRLEADVQDRDADGHLWRYVWLGKTLVNAELIRQGWAYHQPQSPNYRYLDRFARLEKEARRKKRGLWG